MKQATWQAESQLREAARRFDLDQCPTCDGEDGKPVPLTDWGVYMRCECCHFVRDLTSRGQE